MSLGPIRYLFALLQTYHIVLVKKGSYLREGRTRGSPTHALNELFVENSSMILVFVPSLAMGVFGFV